MTNINRGRSIELFFVDGDPDGIVTATIPFQWTGQVLVSRRTQIKEALQRPESNRTGVYLLIGEHDGDQSLYIGESDELKTRIRQHAAEKEWWETAILITATGEPLNKAHVRYLEYKIYIQAKEINKIKLIYGKSPTEGTLSEAARAHMDDFLNNLFLVIPALRFDFLTKDSTENKIEEYLELPKNITFFELSVPRHGLKARARFENGNFIVEKGSIARKNWIGSKSTNSGYQKLYYDLINQGVLKDLDDKKVFTKDYIFKSPTAAAVVTTGRSASGPISWMLEGTGKNYGEWEKEQLNIDN